MRTSPAEYSLATGPGAKTMRAMVIGSVDQIRVIRSERLRPGSAAAVGSGTRVFEGVDTRRVALEPVRAEPTQRVTHLTYGVRQR